MRETDLLDCYLAGEKRKPFEWGKGNGDCLLFLLGWAEIATNRTATVVWRDMYRTEHGAHVALEEFGGAVAAVTDVLGAPRMGSEAKRGDVGLLEVQDWFLGMICTGRMWVLRAGEKGVRFTMRQPDMIWPVGFR
ncbi:hypothetical protein L598_000700000680 [Mesorhizobium sp. J18]|uniref:DUF6950 family protein n=1 Tax=Mesorhizobium sp. J18 TaxID=935263 RepID=UPI00119BA26A|nr:hypothetical protein [Mesorhizobium sp. J18]TWG90312.1 hypothetical protein L598_000700000680 [Mesorhizobium sp. J18]